jgi:hypothetical protein
MKAEWPVGDILSPEYGVTLTGSATNPIVENHSGKAVIGFVVKQADQNGHGPVHQQLLTLSVQPAGIPDSGAVYAKGAVPEPSQRAGIK